MHAVLALLVAAIFIGWATSTADDSAAARARMRPYTYWVAGITAAVWAVLLFPWR